MYATSFRDPSGFVFSKKNKIFRQVNLCYKDNYDFFIRSGLYKKLTEKRLLIPHKENSIKILNSNIAYKLINPEVVSFISYPYEWCFSQLKEAALTTLKIQKIALDYNMSLKDASAYNIQFSRGSPILIDTLSFEKYIEGEPWIAYRQFCQHFISPLALMSYKDVCLNQLLKTFLDGIPLRITSSNLPIKTYFNFSLLTHIHLHAKGQVYFQGKTKRVINKYRIDKISIINLIDNLISTIGHLKLRSKQTIWSNYYENIHYSQIALSHKSEIVKGFLKKVKPERVIDVGANTGFFTRIAAKSSSQVISIDNDPLAVEKNYLECKDKKESKILPLVIDITNPTPALGFANKERMSFLERGSSDMLMVLAIVHHLTIGNNLPFSLLASYFSKLTKWVIIEFIPKNDKKIQEMINIRKDIFSNYTEKSFEEAFLKYFKIESKVLIKDSLRTIYLMRKNEKI